jgi:hypothetical protein
MVVDTRHRVGKGKGLSPPQNKPKHNSRGASADQHCGKGNIFDGFRPQKSADSLSTSAAVSRPGLHHQLRGDDSKSHEGTRCNAEAAVCQPDAAKFQDRPSSSRGRSRSTSRGSTLGSSACSDSEEIIIKPKSTARLEETESELSRRVERQIREIRGSKATNWSTPHDNAPPMNIVVGAGLRFSKDGEANCLVMDVWKTLPVLQMPKDAEAS